MKTQEAEIDLVAGRSKHGVIVLARGRAIDKQQHQPRKLKSSAARSTFRLHLDLRLLYAPVEFSDSTSLLNNRPAFISNEAYGLFKKDILRLKKHRIRKSRSYLVNKIPKDAPQNLFSFRTHAPVTCSETCRR